MSQTVSAAVQLDGAGVLQIMGQMEPSGMQKSPIQQSAYDPISQLNNIRGKWYRLEVGGCIRGVEVRGCRRLEVAMEVWRLEVGGCRSGGCCRCCC